MRILSIQAKVSNAVKNIRVKYAKPFSEGIQSVEKPLVLYILQNEKDFKLDVLRKTANDQYVLPNEQKTLGILDALEQKKIIKPQMPWESPRFNNGVLNDEAYNNIVDKIATSRHLTQYQKEQYINQLATNNYKSYKPTFQGNDVSLDSDIQVEAQEIGEVGTSGFESIENVSKKASAIWGGFKAKCESIKDGISDKLSTAFRGQDASSAKVSIHDPNFVNTDISNVDVSLPKYLQTVLESKDVEMVGTGMEDVLAEMSESIASGEDSTNIFEKVIDNIL